MRGVTLKSFSKLCCSQLLHLHFFCCTKKPLSQKSISIKNLYLLPSRFLTKMVMDECHFGNFHKTLPLEWLSINNSTFTACEEKPLVIYGFAIFFLLFQHFSSFISGEELKAVMLTLGEVNSIIQLLLHGRKAFLYFSIIFTWKKGIFKFFNCYYTEESYLYIFNYYYMEGKYSYIYIFQLLSHGRKLLVYF